MNPPLGMIVNTDEASSYGSQCLVCNNVWGFFSLKEICHDETVVTIETCSTTSTVRSKQEDKSDDVIAEADERSLVSPGKHEEKRNVHLHIFQSI